MIFISSDNYQARLLNYKVKGDYESYIVLFCRLDTIKLKNNHFYKWYYNQLPLVYTILVNQPIIDRMIWFNYYLSEFKILKTLLADFINDNNQELIFDNDEYLALKSIAYKINLLINI